MPHTTNYEIYQTVDRMLRDGEIERASDYLYSLVNEGKASPSDEPITASFRKIYTVKNYLEEYLTLETTGGHQLVHILETLPDDDPGDIFNISDSWDAHHTYIDNTSVGSWVPFNTDKSPKSPKHIGLLEAKGFGQRIPSDCLHSVQFANKVRFCNQHPDLRLAIDDKNRVLRHSIARIGKILPFTLLKKCSSELRRAIVLPIPYSSKNYYHVLAEMIYPLRTAALIDSDCPIVYSEDYFKLLPFFCQVLGINTERLIPFSSVEDTCVAEALLISKSTHYWGPSVFNFFNWSINLGKGRTNPTRFSYISRKNSSRALINEDSLEEAVRALGGEVYYLENMSIKQQISVFESSSLIVGGHGAGLTNIAFCSPATKVLEIFSQNFIHPDFYLRCSQNGMPYFAHIADRFGHVDVHELASDIELALAM